MKTALIVGSFPADLPPELLEKLEAPESEDPADKAGPPESEIEEQFEQFRNSCRALGKELASRRVTIFVGSDRLIDADLYVVEGANQAKGADGRKHEVVVYNPDDSRQAIPQFSEGWESLPYISAHYRRVPGPWQNATNHIIRKVDAVIIIGGRRATMQAGMAAPALGKTPVALTAFGGAADSVFDLLNSTYPSAGKNWSDKLLSQPFETEEKAKKVVDAIEFISRSRPFRHRTTGSRVFSLAMVLALISIWSWLLIDGAKIRAGERKAPQTQQQPAPGDASPTPPAENADPAGGGAFSQAQDIGESTLHLIAILIVAALLGTFMRDGLRVLQDQVTRWDDILSEFIVGVLLSFSLLILYLTSGLLYEGKVLDVSPENFRRTAVTVSTLALASAFLLEAAADQVRKRLGQVLAR